MTRTYFDDLTGLCIFKLSPSHRHSWKFNRLTTFFAKGLERETKISIAQTEHLLPFNIQVCLHCQRTFDRRSAVLIYFCFYFVWSLLNFSLILAVDWIHCHFNCDGKLRWNYNFCYGSTILTILKWIFFRLTKNVHISEKENDEASLKMEKTIIWHIFSTIFYAWAQSPKINHMIQNIFWRFNESWNSLIILRAISIEYIVHVIDYCAVWMCGS